MQVDRLRLLGGYGSNKVMAGEASRLVRRAFSPERSRELREPPPRKLGPGAIAYPFQPDLAALLLCYHRTSARILWDLFETRAERLEPLYDELRDDLRRDRRDWLEGVQRFSVSAFGTGSVRAGERQIVGTVKNALIDAAEERGLRLSVDPSSPQLVLHARSVLPQEGDEDGAQERLVVSIDLLGRPMHQRGYRKLHGVAPLREDLAAQVLFLSRYDAKREAIIDPLAGSGTLLIEATLMAQAAVNCPGDDHFSAPRILGAELDRWGAPLFADTRAVALGAELDPETRAALHENARLAGVSDLVQCIDAGFQELRVGELVPEHLDPIVVSNPPYGSRLDVTEGDLQKLYRELGSFCRDHRISRAAFLVGEPADAPPTRESSVALFLRSFGGKPRVRKPVSNGPLRAQFLLYDSGSRRPGRSV